MGSLNDKEKEFKSVLENLEMVGCSRLNEVVGATADCMPLLGFEEGNCFGF